MVLHADRAGSAGAGGVHRPAAKSARHAGAEQRRAGEDSDAQVNLTIIGTGYVGLVTGACLAEAGNHVVCVDIDQRKIEMLNAGKVPIHEPGLDALIEKNAAYGNAALDPVRIFSRANPSEQIRVRIDDKLSRLARGSAAGEDVIRDLLGYLILLRVSERDEVDGSS